MLHYEVHDNNKDNWVVFVHGIGGSTKTWKRQIDDFSAKYNLLLLDLHGHGKSESGGKVSVAMVNDEIKEVMDYLGISKADFVGMSLGTLVIAQFAIRYPQYVGSIVLGGAVLKVEGIYKCGMWLANHIKHMLPSHMTYSMFANIVIPAKWHKKSRKIFLSESKKLTRESFLSWMEYLSVSLHPKDMVEKLKALKIKIFFISGDRDTCFIDGVKHIVDELKNSKLKILENCGHVCTIERSQDFNKEALLFFDKQHLCYAS